MGALPCAHASVSRPCCHMAHRRPGPPCPVSRPHARGRHHHHASAARASLGTSSTRLHCGRTPPPPPSPPRHAARRRSAVHLARHVPPLNSSPCIEVEFAHPHTCSPTNLNGSPPPLVRARTPPSAIAAAAIRSPLRLLPPLTKLSHTFTRT
jgi:hypothetical protein